MELASSSVRSELVGTVISITAQVGEVLRPGQPIMLIESMKMEIPMVRPDVVELVELTVNIGDVVRAGDLVARVRTVRPKSFGGR